MSSLVSPSIIQRLSNDLFTFSYSSSEPSSTIVSKATECVHNSSNDNFLVHSIHCYFLLPIQSGPVELRLQNIRDGRNISIRYVDVHQHQQHVAIFEFSLQNTTSLAKSVSISPLFPQDVPPPGIVSNQHENNNNNNNNNLAGFQVKRCPSRENTDITWIKVPNSLSSSTSSQAKQQLLAFLSDYRLLQQDRSTEAYSHLEHSLWFHDFHFDMTSWLLVTSSTKTCTRDRCLSEVFIWSITGQLLCSSVQETFHRPISSL